MVAPPTTTFGCRYHFCNIINEIYFKGTFFLCESLVWAIFLNGKRQNPRTAVCIVVNLLIHSSESPGNCVASLYPSTFSVVIRKTERCNRALWS